MHSCGSGDGLDGLSPVRVIRPATIPSQRTKERRLQPTRPARSVVRRWSFAMAGLARSWLVRLTRSVETPGLFLPAFVALCRVVTATWCNGVRSRGGSFTVAAIIRSAGLPVRTRRSLSRALVVALRSWSGRITNDAGRQSNVQKRLAGTPERTKRPPSKPREAVNPEQLVGVDPLLTELFPASHRWFGLHPTRSDRDER
jgi:hypothetical protein